MVRNIPISRRRFVRRLAAGMGLSIVPATALGLAGRPAPSERIVIGCIGMGGQGCNDADALLAFPQVEVVRVCDVVRSRREHAVKFVNERRFGQRCEGCVDFRELTGRGDIDAVLIATPDHWHAPIAADAMRNGKDVYCEKPETLTIREGRTLVDLARRYGRVFSGGSQRVWDDYRNFHRWVRSGALGRIREVWVDVGGPPVDCNLPAQNIPEGVDWDLWLGPAPWAPFNHGRLVFFDWRDYSGGEMTNWGSHGFGGALFACGLHETGPVQIIPPDGKDHPLLTFVFADGLRLYRGAGPNQNLLHWNILDFKGTDGEMPGPGYERPPHCEIPNYRGEGGIFGDFLHCIRTRERPFRDIEIAHRTATVCHLGNIAHWLGRPLKWDPSKEEFSGDAEANRFLDRARRAPWRL